MFLRAFSTAGAGIVELLQLRRDRLADLVHLHPGRDPDQEVSAGIGYPRHELPGLHRGREYQIDERFKQNDWLDYQFGKIIPGGWLTENSYAWRTITILSYSAPFGMHYNEVLREAHKWNGEIAKSGSPSPSGDRSRLSPWRMVL